MITKLSWIPLTPAPGLTKFRAGDWVRYRPDLVEEHYARHEYEVFESGIDPTGEDCVYMVDEWENISPCIRASALMKIEIPS
jgi:hypothetical protein